MLDEEEAASSTESYELYYPKGYLIDDSVFSSYVLSGLEKLKASSIVAYGDGASDPAIYEKCGLDLDPERLEAGTEKCVAKLLFSVTDKYGDVNDFVLYFGDAFYDDATAAEYRYVYSSYSNVIFTLPTYDYEYVTWHSVRFISARIYSDYINTLDYLELSGRGGNVRFTMTGDYLTYHVDVTESGDDGKAILRNGKPLTFDVDPRKVVYGSFTETRFFGEFENFRDLYHVLITRSYAVDVTPDPDAASSDPVRVITIKKSDRDINQTFYRYDTTGNRIVDSTTGNYVTVIYDGGYIRCTNVKLKTTGLDGEERILSYDTAYYDEAKGKFFLKVEDRADSYFKPSNYKVNSEGHLSDWTYMNGKVEAEYEEKVYRYLVYDVLYDYTDADGNVSKRVNQTYSFVVPEIETFRYRINYDGTKELIETKKETADGLYMRTFQIDKLYSDAEKVIAGQAIDVSSPN